MGDELAQLQALGLSLPSPAAIFAGIVFGLIGFVAFRSGRRQQNRPRLWLGVALMVYPYLVSSTWALYAVGLLLCGGLWLARD